MQSNRSEDRADQSADLLNDLWSFLGKYPQTQILLLREYGRVLSRKGQSLFRAGRKAEGLEGLKLAHIC